MTGAKGLAVKSPLLEAETFYRRPVTKAFDGEFVRPS